MVENIIRDYGLYIIIAEFVIIIVLLFWHSFYVKEVASLKRDKHYLESHLNSMNQAVREYERRNNNLKFQLNNLTVESKNNHLPVYEDSKPIVIDLDISQECTKPAEFVQPSYQFLQEAYGGKFMKLLTSPEKCYFRTWEEGDVRKYEFYGNVSKALANINAIFDDVCDIEGKRSGAMDIENVCAGTLDSNLRIINKAKIRLK